MGARLFVGHNRPTQMSSGYTPYIPTKNADLNNWMANFAAVAAAAPSAYGLTSANIATINAANANFGAAYAPLTSPSTKTKAAVSAFNGQRAASLAQVTPLAVQISASPSISNDNKTSIGVTVRKTTRSPLPVPTTQPSLSLVAMLPGSLQLAYVDGAAPGGKQKPFGAVGMEVWTNIGTVPATDPSQASYIQSVSKSPFLLTYDPTNSGKVMTVYGRWTTKGTLASHGVAQPGPFGPRLFFNLP
jgi:hypothetical protein